jgi:hypothetical protein
MRSMSVGTAAVLLLMSASSALGEYNPTLALEALYYSNAVKCIPGTTVLNWTCGPSCEAAGDFTDITFVYNDTLQARGFVGYHAQSNRIIQSYRGTKTLLNWLEDFDFKKVPFTADPSCGSACEVHQGFYVTYEFMAQAIRPATAALLARHPTASVVVTGHSLGAAQSQFGMLDALKLVAASTNPTRRVALINFGCPRVGNAAFAEWAMGQIVAAPAAEAYRVVHDADPVPMLPLVSMGFEHFPRYFVWYNASVPAPGWVVCNRTGVQQQQTPTAADHTRGALRMPAAGRLLALAAVEANVEMSNDCGAASVWQANPDNHVWYLGVPMNCKMDSHYHY